MVQVIGASEADGLIGDNACVFSGTLTTDGLKIRPDGAGRLVLDQDGAVEKWVPGVQQLTFNGKYARERGQRVLFVTDRAVFDLSAGGIVLTEFATRAPMPRGAHYSSGRRTP